MPRLWLLVQSTGPSRPWECSPRLPLLWCLQHRGSELELAVHWACPLLVWPSCFLSFVTLDSRWTSGQGPICTRTALCIVRLLSPSRALPLSLSPACASSSWRRLGLRLQVLPSLLAWLWDLGGSLNFICQQSSCLLRRESVNISD